MLSSQFTRVSASLTSRRLVEAAHHADSAGHGGGVLSTAVGSCPSKNSAYMRSDNSALSNLRDHLTSNSKSCLWRSRRSNRHLKASFTVSLVCRQQRPKKIHTSSRCLGFFAAGADLLPGGVDHDRNPGPYSRKEKASPHRTVSHCQHHHRITTAFVLGSRGTTLERGRITETDSVRKAYVGKTGWNFIWPIGVMHTGSWQKESEIVATTTMQVCHISHPKPLYQI